jgi:putative pyruvate formate lyase activating enzyme
MKPSYLENLSLSEIKDRAEELHKLQKNCRLCPHNCEIERTEGKIGVCFTTDKPKISSVHPHFGEEPPLVGTNGSGTIFFTNCNLNCLFCQNFDISQLHGGREVSLEQLANAMLNLQNIGCHNINFVTPTHVIPQIVDALILAIQQGLEIPLVYNCGGYESVETLKLLDGIIDIYMPDIKYSDNEFARKYSGAKNYWDVVRKALKEMHKQVGDLQISRRGFAQRGLLVRHLVLPNNIAGSVKVIDFVAQEISADSYLNIMDQFRPSFRAHKIKELNRSISHTEYSDVVDYAIAAGITRGL